MVATTSPPFLPAIRAFDNRLDLDVPSWFTTFVKLSAPSSPARPSVHYSLLKTLTPPATLPNEATPSSVQLESLVTQEISQPREEISTPSEEIPTPSLPILDSFAKQLKPNLLFNKGGSWLGTTVSVPLLKLGWIPEKIDDEESPWSKGILEITLPQSAEFGSFMEWNEPMSLSGSLGESFDQATVSLTLRSFRTEEMWSLSFITKNEKEITFGFEEKSIFGGEICWSSTDLVENVDSYGFMEAVHTSEEQEDPQWNSHPMDFNVTRKVERDHFDHQPPTSTFSPPTSSSLSSILPVLTLDMSLNFNVNSWFDTTSSEPITNHGNFYPHSPPPPYHLVAHQMALPTPEAPSQPFPLIIQTSPPNISSSKKEISTPSLEISTSQREILNPGSSYPQSTVELVAPYLSVECGRLWPDALEPICWKKSYWTDQNYEMDLWENHKCDFKSLSDSLADVSWTLDSFHNEEQWSSRPSGGEITSKSLQRSWESQEITSKSPLLSTSLGIFVNLPTRSPPVLAPHRCPQRNLKHSGKSRAQLLRTFKKYVRRELSLLSLLPQPYILAKDHDQQAEEEALPGDHVVHSDLSDSGDSFEDLEKESVSQNLAPEDFNEDFESDYHEDDDKEDQEVPSPQNSNLPFKVALLDPQMRHTGHTNGVATSVFLFRLKRIVQLAISEGNIVDFDD